MSGPIRQEAAESCVLAAGHQVLPKTEIKEAPHGVDVASLIFRFPAEDTDLVCTLNARRLRESLRRRIVRDLEDRPVGASWGRRQAVTIRVVA